MPSNQGSLDGQIKLIRIDNRKPTLDAIRDGYPFWAVEYLYSADNLPRDSLAKAFSTYHDHTCQTPDASARAVLGR